MKLKQTSIVFSCAALIMLAANAFFLVQIYQTHILSIEAQQHRQDALSLVNDLRLQTNRLARLIQTYATTGQPRYLMYYYDILAIRQGEKPLPVGYDSTYWDRVIAGETSHKIPKSGKSQSLSAQMRSMGFGIDEMDSLKKIFTVTESMKQIEQIAFAATQGLYDPVKKEFVDDGKPDLEFASGLLHGKEYNKLNSDLSIAVENLIKLTNKRTDKAVANADNKLTKWLLSSILTMILTIAMVSISLYVIRRQILQPIDRLADVAAIMAQGNYAIRMSLKTGVDEFVSLSRTFNSMAQAIEEDIYQRQKIQNDLEIANKQAEEATRAKSIFLANMSHEIRTPMNAIIGMAYLVLRTELSDYQKDHIGKIHNAAQSLLGIINDILDFSKVDAGKLELEQTAFSLDNVINNALTLQLPHAQEKNIELLTDYEKGKTLVGDGLRLGQIITNLLSNAVKFTHQGYVRLGVHTVSQADNMLTLRFTFQDTGIGMTPEQLSGLFREFTQADGSTTRKYGGTGLGLTISKKLTELMGGKIWADSESEKGTTFHVEIPFAASSNIVSQTDEDVAETFNLNGMRVLLAEDNAINQQIAVELMNIQGVHVDVADNGSEAIQKLDAVAPDYYDLVLMDIQMPVMDGYEATQRLRVMPCYDKLPIVAMTAHAMREEIEKCKGLGMNDHINKPIEPDVFYRILARYYKKIKKDKLENIPISSPQTMTAPEFPAIEGVNVKDGLRRLGGNVAFYRKLLTQFVNNYRLAVENLFAGIELENCKTSEIKAHTLKGLLGTIGSEILQDVAGKIEKALKLQDIATAKLMLEDFKQPFAELINDIAKALDRMPTPASEPVAADKDTSTNWVAKFRDLLKESDFEVVKIWETRKSSLSGMLAERVINDITKAVNDFDFDEAVSLIDEHLSE